MLKEKREESGWNKVVGLFLVVREKGIRREVVKVFFWEMKKVGGKVV